MKYLMILLSIFCLNAVPAVAGEQNKTPLVKGGITDKPFITQVNRTLIGGYTEAHFRYERQDGITEELLFENKRFNLFTYSAVSDRVRVAAELEFEEGGEEIKIELAIIDFEVHPSLTFRGGILLAPLGRFNLVHDSPTNDLTDRPLVSTQLIPTALSEAGMGVYGALYPSVQTRITYEIYAVNGFNDLYETASVTRISEGKGNFEDNNNRPAVVGRLGISPMLRLEVGASMHHGAYNVWEIEGVKVTDKHNLTLWALDWEYAWKRFELVGEYAAASIDVPKESGIFADSQAGLYGQLNTHFGQGWIGALPDSKFTGVVRFGALDFDTNTDGDSIVRWTFGLNFRPQEETVFKLDYRRNWSRDSFNNLAKGAALLFSLATYF
jgi:hypothetical protein